MTPLLFHQNEHEDKDFRDKYTLNQPELRSRWFVKAGHAFSYLQNSVAVHGRHIREESPETGEKWTLVMLPTKGTLFLQQQKIEETFLISAKKNPSLYLQQCFQGSKTSKCFCTAHAAF